MAREGHVRLITGVRSGRDCGSRGCARWLPKPGIKLRPMNTDNINPPIGRERNKSNMNLILLLLVLLLLFGGGGFYYGGPVYGGGGVGLILLIILIVFLAGGFRGRK